MSRNDRQPDLPGRDRPVALSEVRLAPSRKAEGRKIDTWLIEIPERSPCEFEIRLHVRRDEAWFDACTSDPGLRHISGITGTDINDLRARLDRAVQDYAEELLGETWEPGLLLEAGVHSQSNRRTGRGTTSCSVELRLEIEPLRAARPAPGQNAPLRRVLRGTTVTSVLERGRLDEFPQGETLSDQVRWSNERDTPVGRSLIPDTDETRAQVEDLRAVLVRFGEVLADRLSPDHMHAGLPAPSDLPDLMQEALRRMSEPERPAQEPDFF